MFEQFHSIFEASSEESLNNQEKVTSSNDEVQEIPPLTYRGEEEEQVSSIQEELPVADKGTTSTIPSSYVSNSVTSIKNQNPHGTCWAFSYIAASEASIVSEGLADSAVDLSKWQLAYFTTHTVDDPLEGTEGDSFTVNGDYLNAGGNQLYTAHRVATWQGLVAKEVHYEKNQFIKSNGTYQKSR